MILLCYWYSNLRWPDSARISAGTSDEDFVYISVVCSNRNVATRLVLVMTVRVLFPSPEKRRDTTRKT